MPPETADAAGLAAACGGGAEEWGITVPAWGLMALRSVLVTMGVFMRLEAQDWARLGPLGAKVGRRCRVWMSLLVAANQTPRGRSAGPVVP
jgi:hypothetical protein